MIDRRFLCGLFLISGLFCWFSLESSANNCQRIALERIYSGDLKKDLFLNGRDFNFQWDINHHPVRYQKSKKESVPQPAARQFIDKTKRKGIAASGPEPAAPAFSGFFPGYPPGAKSSVYHLPLIGLSPGLENCFKIRPPPAKSWSILCGLDSNRFICE